MTNAKLQEILSTYPKECEILIGGENNNSFKILDIIVQYFEDDNFTMPKIILDPM